MLCRRCFKLIQQQSSTIHIDQNYNNRKREENYRGKKEEQSEQQTLFKVHSAVQVGFVRRRLEACLNKTNFNS
jgi:predicted transcriptional regulator of viral defense system